MIFIFLFNTSPSSSCLKLPDDDRCCTVSGEVCYGAEINKKYVFLRNSSFFTGICRWNYWPPFGWCLGLCGPKIPEAIIFQTKSKHGDIIEEEKENNLKE